jgi:hypothetical protein
MSSMSQESRAAVQRFARAVNGRTLGGRALQAVAVTAALAAAALLIVRAFGDPVAPSWWWLALLAPALAAALLRARREWLPADAAAAHLDRRLGLEGLLLAAYDGGALGGEMQARLRAGLSSAQRASPALRWRRVLPQALGGGALLAAVALLPAPAAPQPLAPTPAMQLAVDRLQEKLQQLQRGHLPDEVRDELQQRIAELDRRVEQGQVPGWSELDRLDERLDRESLLERLRAEEAQRAAAAAAVAAASQSGTTQSEARSTAQLAAAVAQAAQALDIAGKLGALPEALRKQLGQLRSASGAFDPGQFAADAKALQELAAALAQCGEQAAAGDLAAAAATGDLKQVLAACANGGDGGASSGKGGVDRGPGAAALAFDNDARGGAPQALPLPPGQQPPSEWVPVGSRRIEPNAEPPDEAHRVDGKGSDADGGRLGASWQLRALPRHRAVLQKYFGAESTNRVGR